MFSTQTSKKGMEVPCARKIVDATNEMTSAAVTAWRALTLRGTVPPLVPSAEAGRCNAEPSGSTHVGDQHCLVWSARWA
jgi:hypothetical protein